MDCQAKSISYIDNSIVILVAKALFELIQGVTPDDRQQQLMTNYFARVSSFPQALSGGTQGEDFATAYRGADGVSSLTDRWRACFEHNSIAEAQAESFIREFLQGLDHRHANMEHLATLRTPIYTCTIFLYI
jgi:hypothetical protein